MSIDTPATHVDVSESVSAKTPVETAATDNIMDEVNAQRSTSNAVAQSPETNNPYQFYPDLQLEGGFDDVVGDVFSGAVDQLTQNPLEVGKNILIGGAIGLGALIVAPEVLAVAAIAGAGYGLYQLATHLPGWIEDADVVANPDQHTAAEVAQSHEDLQDLGGGITNFVAGAAGGGLVAKGVEVLAQNMLKNSLSAGEGAFTQMFKRVDAEGVIDDPANQFVNATFKKGGAPFEVPSVLNRTEAEMMVTNANGQRSFTNWQELGSNYKPIGNFNQSKEKALIENLTDPAEIAAFARQYYQTYPNVAAPNLQMSISREFVKPGTKQAWIDAIAQLPGGKAFTGPIDPMVALGLN